MTDFTKKPTEGVNNPNYSFYTIYVDDKSPFKEFCDSLKQKKDLDSLDAIYAIMDRLGPTILNSTIVNHIKGGKHDRNDVYEFKKNAIRVYFILQKPNVFILLGGYKVNQKSDISKVFRKFNNLPDNIPDHE